MSCLKCYGTGKTIALIKAEEDCDLENVTCVYCDGTGNDNRNPLWIEAGRLQRAARLGYGETLMTVANKNGLSPMDISNMERGFIEPFSGFIRVAKEAHDER